MAPAARPMLCRRPRSWSDPDRAGSSPCGAGILAHAGRRLVANRPGPGAATAEAVGTTGDYVPFEVDEEDGAASDREYNERPLRRLRHSMQHEFPGYRITQQLYLSARSSVERVVRSDDGAA